MRFDEKSKKLKVLITGGSGFIGKYLLNELTHHGIEVTVIDKIRPTSDEMILPAENRLKLKVMIHDLRRPLRLKEQYDECVVLASTVGGIQYFETHEINNLRYNTRILLNTFEACARADIKKVTYFSSSVVYQFAKKFPTSEDEVGRIPPPCSAYGITKLLGEYFCMKYREELGLPYTILRPFNAYGPGEEADMEYAHVIPQLTRKVLTGQYPVEIFGSGKQTRCFTYATDIARAARVCLDNPIARNEIFNVSSQEEVTIIGLLELIWNLCMMPRPLRIRHLKPFPDDVQKRLPSIDKIRTKIAWEPEVKITEGLKLTIDWIRKSLASSVRETSPPSLNGGTQYDSFESLQARKNHIRRHSTAPASWDGNCGSDSPC